MFGYELVFTFVCPEGLGVKSGAAFRQISVGPKYSETISFSYFFRQLMTLHLKD